MLVIGGVSAGAVVAVAAIAISSRSSAASPATPAADQSPATTPPASPTASRRRDDVAVRVAERHRDPGRLAAVRRAVRAVLHPAPHPWQGASCPSALDNGAFTWTAGEDAIAGQVNGGSEAWYGEACSGPLPQQYGYTSSAQLQTTAVNLAQTFQNAYYGDLNHTVTQELSQPVSVSGHVGWEITYDVVYTDQADQGETWSDEQAAVVVVDNGTDRPPCSSRRSRRTSGEQRAVPGLVAGAVRVGGRRDGRRRDCHRRLR